MSRSWQRRRRTLAVLGLVVALLGACSTTVDGTGTTGPADLKVAGDSGDSFDTLAKNALSDVIGFWETAYPKVSGGKALPPLRGKLYSVDGSQVLQTKRAPTAVASNGCLKQQLSFIVDNAAYCRVDDSIIWDRAPGHLLPVLSSAYGPDLTALVFAHEFGHAVQARLGISRENLPTIDLESQADCAAGAFAAAAMNGRAPHFHITAAGLDKAIAGFLQIRDSTPESPSDISHGDGFDRLNALQEGITGGVTYCYGATFFKDRSFTERGYVHDDDYLAGGNEPLAEVVAAKDSLSSDLNRFWTAAGKTVGKTFAPVTLTEAAHPQCGSSSSSEFGYCPSDNTVYYSSAYAHKAYYSMTTLDIDEQTAQVTLDHDQAGDYALGALISIGWGMAARHQFFDGSTGDRAGLVAAVCYAGAYAEDINRANYDATHQYILSPPDMDEATSAVLSLVEGNDSFGARGTSGLQRIQAFVKGYTSGLHGC